MDLVHGHRVRRHLSASASRGEGESPRGVKRFRAKPGAYHRRPCESRDPYAAAFVLRNAVRRLWRNNQRLWLWVPAFAGTTSWSRATSQPTKKTGPLGPVFPSSPGAISIVAAVEAVVMMVMVVVMVVII